MTVNWYHVAAIGPDRTWALSRAFNRNLNDPGCVPSLNTPKARHVPDAEMLTLGQAAKKLDTGEMPAFTLNTSVAETGGRFLLANYQVPAARTFSRNTEFLPAASFLQVYAQDTCCANGLHGEKLFADLPLSTAARLSATFPVVSSATRVPPNNAGSNRVTAYQCVGEKLPHYRGRPLDLSWTVGLSEKAVGKREQ